jgi:hypothetical protein
LVTDEWGIEVRDLRISDLVPVTTLRHVTDDQTIEVTGHVKTEAVIPDA